MKHAGAGALESLGEVLESLRRRTPLVEKRTGIFYVRGKAFLHFTNIAPAFLPMCGIVASGGGLR